MELRHYFSAEIVFSSKISVENKRVSYLTMMPFSIKSGKLNGLEDVLNEL
ncbi:hypothetical protein NC99_27200 [Sunxiuqinia dokdonensis]|uniref:Uncharacterized protein n=1 Tax=Sunxiuqinia dokdonensis TaxID=1409788 RepID=A0A0L8V7N3_9BACT|nr:hypothetical protein NC99_27200 [Sunxiuqinia dokdonensis]